MSVMTEPKKPHRPKKQQPTASVPPAQPSAPVTPPDGDDAATPNRSGRPVNVWVSDDVYDAMERFRQSRDPFPPTKTDIVEVALQEFLKKLGFYPPAT